MIDPRMAALQQLMAGGRSMPSANTGMPPDALMEQIMQQVGGGAPAAPPSAPGPGSGLMQQLAMLSQEGAPAVAAPDMMSGAATGFGGDAQSGEHVAEMLGRMVPRDEQPRYHDKGFDPYMKYPEEDSYGVNERTDQEYRARRNEVPTYRKGVDAPYRVDDPIGEPVPALRSRGQNDEAMLDDVHKEMSSGDKPEPTVSDVEDWLSGYSMSDAEFTDKFGMTPQEAADMHGIDIGDAER